ncbi:uncharacterized protein C8A04DRAFT_15260 [Dichotomopilus funicola]|uniref:PH domain-containing protein n=1 Tax=Dichotomopilus funicola TaxID=1934379 RepID=A0AAN6UVP4_9PEZI|nr:hypothetical protein C8A04DRAFT_15260 [Dichotomopilus funicola]
MSTPRATPRPNGYDSAGYFPTQHSQPTHHPNPADVNTTADTQADYGSHLGPASMPPTKFTEEWEASQRGSSILDSPGPGAMQRSVSYSGNTTSGGAVDGAALSRGNTLRKKASVRRSASLKRSGSRRSMKAGSVRSLALQPTTDEDGMHSAFYCPVPTTANPTEALANRFQAWRKTLKDLIAYFREIQTHYEHRAKSLVKLANVLNNTATPPSFLASGGLDDALQILRGYNKQAITEASKAKEIEEDVILALTGLRSDLQQKIKEIKNLSGDFKNSVDKEMDGTRKAVNQLQEALGQSELDPSLTVGKQDPYLLRLAVDRQLERQIDEENYLHQAYLNLESSGKELESIVVGEIQKAYSAYAGILKREADAAYGTIEELRAGPVSMPKDHEWSSFIQRDERFVNPELPMRLAQSIHYPGRDHYACQEIRAGLLERKSKYLKSYTPGWYVLSPTHLHEYKSADKTQAPLMSLYLVEQKLGSHSADGSSSNKFILKGRQTGSMHRGHKWVFRAESHDTMMAWYDDIKAVTERTPEERNNLVRANSRSISRSSQRSSVSSDGVDDEEEPPFTANVASVNQHARQDSLTRRPSGGRFPSDLQVNAQRGLHAPVSPMSASSGYCESYNQHYPVAAVAPTNNDLGQWASNEDSIQSTAPVDGSGGGPVQLPGVAATTASQRRGSDELGLVNRSVSTKLAGAVTPQQQLPQQNDVPTWAEPIPVSSLQAQQLSSAGRYETGSDLYASHGTQTPNGVTKSNSTGSRMSCDGETVRASWAAASSDGDGTTGAEPAPRPGTTVRTDSIQTISNLHIPGQFPRGSNAGT